MCEHDWSFLRRVIYTAVYERRSEDIVADLFFCRHCLEYQERRLNDDERVKWA